MKIYLASPFFNKEEITIYRQVIGRLRANEENVVYVPQEHEIPNAWDLPHRVWQTLCTRLILKLFKTAMW